MNFPLFKTLLVAAVVLGLACLTASWASAANYGINLLVDGNAENALNGWNSINSPAVVQYGTAGGFPTATDPGPPDRLKAFFAGGSNPSSSLFQNIILSANAADVDAGKVACDVSAWLGGFLNDGDNARFDVHFFDGNNKDLLAISLGPVTTADRGGKTGLLNRVQTVAVPAGTRTILANIQMTRDPNNGGAYNDGYADSLSIILRGPVVVTTTSNVGAGSLRDAVPRATVITFDPTVFAASGAPHVITLPGDLPDITQDLTITGPGADILTVQSTPGGGASYAFPVVGTNSLQPKVRIEALTMRGTASAVSALKADLTLDHVVISDMSTGSAGALIGSSTVHLTNSAITRNKVHNAVSSIDSTVDLQSCTISGNTSDLPAGVAIATFSSMVSLTGCTISGNSGTATNSSIFYSDRSDLSLLNCTISDNSIPSGDIFFVSSTSSTSTLGLFNDTIAGNSASHSVHSDGSAQVSFNNTIFADSGPTFSSTGGSLTSTGYNLSTHNDKAVLNQTSDQNSSDPKLGPLQNNGGPTFTRALLPGSLAIDEGNSILAIDQRGAPRPFDDPNSPNGSGNNNDIGAFEFQGTPPVVLANISGRLPVGTGDNALFAGFIVSGYQPKKVIIRAIGPSLGIAGLLSDPILELRDSNGFLLQTNDNWKDSPNKQAIIDSTVPPSNDLESAIVATLPASIPGTSYTAIVRGTGNATGIGVVEVYDLDRTVDSKLANISNRGFVQTGDNALFAGNIVVGEASQKVIIRAIGPSLLIRGGTVMADPTLELHDANGGLLESNDNWVDSPNKQAIIDSTIPPTNNLESAIVRTLSPANYTAIVRGANNSTGIAVVEIYALK